MFIGLNPSTADEIIDDPTVRRCIGYARDWGHVALCMTNLFAFRATSPIDMKAAKDPIGPDNDRILIEMAKGAGIIVAAWGIHGAYRGRDKAVMELIPSVFCLGKSKNGYPRHPLYLRKDVKLEILA